MYNNYTSTLYYFYKRLHLCIIFIYTSTRIYCNYKINKMMIKLTLDNFVAMDSVGDGDKLVTDVELVGFGHIEGGDDWGIATWGYRRLGHAVVYNRHV